MVRPVIFVMILSVAYSSFGQESRFLPHPNAGPIRPLKSWMESDIEEQEKLIRLLSSVSLEDYPSKIADIREQIQNYIEMKSNICKGKISVYILNPRDDQDDRLISRDERKECYNSLRHFRVIYTEKEFRVRKKYVN